ncbi:MAG: NTP transferase domain-containing protein [Gemmatimonadales bacterium]|nr:NTP transferase domain-containing protein [Gemmatimonadales bacterium]
MSSATPSEVTQAVVLVGGKGTRLGGLTSETPKPLLDVGGRPFLEWVLARLGRQGIDRVVLTAGYRVEALRAWLHGATLDIEVDVFVEDEPLGTGGAFPAMVDRLDDRFFALNGDTLFDVDLGDLTLAAGEGECAVALRQVEDTARYGRVRQDGSRVTTFAEKASGGPGWINGGVYLLQRDVVATLPQPASLEDGLLPALARDRALVGVRSNGFFIDIGVPESYAAAQRSVPEWWAAKYPEARS